MIGVLKCEALASFHLLSRLWTSLSSLEEEEKNRLEKEKINRKEEKTQSSEELNGIEH